MVCVYKENKILGSYIHYVLHFRGKAGLDQFYVTLNSFFFILTSSFSLILYQQIEINKPIKGVKFK